MRLVLRSENHEYDGSEVVLLGLIPITKRLRRVAWVATAGGTMLAYLDELFIEPTLEDQYGSFPLRGVTSMMTELWDRRSYTRDVPGPDNLKNTTR